MHKIWHSIRPFLFFVGAILILIGIVFRLYQLPYDVMYLLMACCIIVAGIYLIVQYQQFQAAAKQQVNFDELQLEFTAYKQHQTRQQRELEAYFLMWVHQIKTPITAVQLLLDRAPLDCSAIAREMTQIENYSNMAMNYLKLSNPDRDMVFAVCAIDDIMKPLIRKYRLQFIANQIRLDYQISNSKVLTDANLSSVMIEQILNNALKYSKPATQIKIYFDSQTSQLSIEDQGIGIRATDLPKIFERGFSGFNGQLNQKSSGIGLYLVHLIAQRLNQPVAVSSQEQVGTCFKIQFKQA